ncbi:sodium/hydrogen exchanger 9B1-like isoform X2 [Leptidea sinapis]|uniref:sodium/hydrogen exchanger 9B1-like isoform X2 n=1 Tax=Leptidea sinapis TaxID=189913 RepID=UPI0021C2CB5E|nr:sodium/hydrogen exchanger 9B1-like isoform X2 [Leptidea sinapis]
MIRDTSPSDVIPTINIDSIETRVRVKKKVLNKKSKPVLLHYLTLGFIGVSVWGTLWCAFGEKWAWNGSCFRISVVGTVAWASGQILQDTTTLPAHLAALLTGILARHIGFLDMREHSDIDSFLRRVYPVIILGKGSLGWDLNYMKHHWRQVVCLGCMPWVTEVAVVATCTHFFLSFPWIWGILLGAVYSSVSCPIIMPSVVKHGQSYGGDRNWPQLVCTAGGVDTALSVGVFGVVFTYILGEETDTTYRYVKACSALFVGVLLGAIWGNLAKLVPKSDYYVTELRILFVLAGGIFCNFLTSRLGWGGTGGVAVLACNATAAMHWAEQGWKLNQNPAATTYRVLWSALEPLVFAYTGTFFVINRSVGNTLLIGLGILCISLFFRLTVAYNMCWNLRVKERLFVCCAWTPKSIVEAVLAPLAVSTIISSQGTNPSNELLYAEDILRLLVQAIVITGPIGFLLTDKLGPMLLRENCKPESDPQKEENANNSLQAEV